LTDMASIILFVISCAGGTIRGITRLQKILFLLQQEVGICNFHFMPFKFGPYSPEVTITVNSLEKQNLLKIDKEVGYSLLQENPTQVISLTDEGQLKAQEVAESLDTITRLKAQFIIDRFSRVPLTYLIAYIYAKYPEFTTLSEIKDAVREWRSIYELRFQILPR